MKRLIAFILAIAALSSSASIPAAASVPFDPGLCGNGAC